MHKFHRRLQIVRLARLLSFPLMLMSFPAQAAAPSLQVLHWWTSAGERHAANVLAARLEDEGDHLAGRGNSRRGRAWGRARSCAAGVLAGNAPDATQIIGGFHRGVGGTGPAARAG
ncbi:hypothetical protein [Massilia eburnea]|uniref:hypothetical protein n=1 Tax=Massilia eburnea TaxID=1776165 RepID=UPI003D6A86DC